MHEKTDCPQCRRREEAARLKVRLQELLEELGKFRLYERVELLEKLLAEHADN